MQLPHLSITGDHQRLHVEANAEKRAGDERLAAAASCVTSRCGLLLLLLLLLLRDPAAGLPLDLHLEHIHEPSDCFRAFARAACPLSTWRTSAPYNVARS